MLSTRPDGSFAAVLTNTKMCQVCCYVTISTRSAAAEGAEYS